MLILLIAILTYVAFSRRQKIDACGFWLIEGCMDGHHWNDFLPKQEKVWRIWGSIT